MEYKFSYNIYKFSYWSISMKDNFTLLGFEKLFNIEKIITLFYMELPKNFYYDGEYHDF